jgi:LPS O-antigen subunit length determinant protein (WzzB/FepE family)
LISETPRVILILCLKQFALVRSSDEPHTPVFGSCAPYSISMEGSNPEAITRFLNELVAADILTIDELIINIKQKIAIRLDEISLERRLLLLKAKDERLNQIEILNEEAKIAKSLGVIENNFKLFSDNKINSNLTFDIGENKDLPGWYLYGEKALLEAVELLESRSSDIPFIPKLIDLDVEKNKLESSIIDLIDVNSMRIIQIALIPTFPIPIKSNQRMIVLQAFIGSFMISICLALVLGALKPGEENST